MRELKLTQGQVVLVDDCDYEWLNQWKWFAWYSKTVRSFYAVRNSPQIKNKQGCIYMHRLILGLEYGDKRQGDHRNHNTLDNHRDNLRICTHSQSMMNRKSFQNTTSQFKGVHWHKASKKWAAQIKLNKKSKYLGEFRQEIDAAESYNKAAKEYFGDFACLNKIGESNVEN